MIAHSVTQELEDRGISRRDFLQFCTAMAAVLGFPDSAAQAIAAAIEGEARPILIWLEFQDCAGNTESFLRASHPTVADLILDTISLNYHETLMAAAGSQAESALEQTVRDNKGKYIALVEGSIPTGADGAPIARSAGNPLCKSHAMSAALPRPPSPSAPARRSAAFRRRVRIPPVRCPSPTRCLASRTSSTCRRVPPTPRTLRRSSSIT